MLCRRIGSVRNVLVRCKSTSSEAAEMTSFADMAKPKLSLFGTSAKYANALYSVSMKAKTLETTEKELQTIQQQIHESEKFASFLNDPTIARHLKKQDITKIMDQGKFSKPVAGLFTILAENGRLPDTTNVISAYSQLMSAYRGEVAVKVTSAEPLTSAQLTSVTKALSNHMKPEEKPIIETVVESDMLGGLKVQIGNMFIDLSLATKIDKIHQVMAVPV